MIRVLQMFTAAIVMIVGPVLCGQATTANPRVKFPVSLECAQPVTTAAPAAPVASMGLYRCPAQIPPVLLHPFFALGDRLMKPGNERITLQGTLTDTAGTSGVQIVIELGGKLNITWTGPGTQKVVFDGTAPSVSGAISSSNDLLASFVDDLAETLLLAGRGSSPRLLGQRFADASGGFCDFYDVATYGSAVKLSKPFIKRYCFDSETSLLKSVRYYRNSQLVVTEFGGWTSLNQQAVFGTVIRTVAGSRIFQFQALGSVVSAGVPDNTFKP